jgi:DNA-binding NarL/FixJ family response regulator
MTDVPTPIRRILVAEDQNMLRTVLASTLARHYKNADILQAKDGRETVILCLKFSPDVVLLDNRMPDPVGISVAREILERQPGIRIILVTNESPEHILDEARAVGIVGFVSKNCFETELFRAIGLVCEGKTSFPLLKGGGKADRVSEPTVAYNAKLSGLTRREQQVYLLLKEGQAPAAIAEKLSLSYRTVTTHLGNIYEKTGTHRAVELISMK